MPTKPQKFTHDSLQDRDALVAYLRAVADGVARGELTLSAGDEELVLTPQGLLQVRLRARRGTYRGELALRVSWREPDAGASNGGAPLRISPGSP